MITLLVDLKCYILFYIQVICHLFQIGYYIEVILVSARSKEVEHGIIRQLRKHLFPNFKLESVFFLWSELCERNHDVLSLVAQLYIICYVSCINGWVSVE